MMKYLPNWIIGVLLTLLSTAVGSLGKVLIRCVYLRQSSSDYSIYLKVKFSKTPIIASCLLNCPIPILSFISQFCVVVLNPILSVISYSYAAQSLLTPFAGLSIVWSMLLSTFLLPEKPDKSKISTGCIIISFSASHTPTTYTIDNLVDLSYQPSNILFMVVYWLFIIAMVTVVSGLVFEEFQGLAFGLIAGSLSGNQIFIKSLSTILMQYIDGIPVYTYPWVYYCIFMAGLTAGGGILCLNAGLRKYEAMYIIPIYQGSFILIGSISGILFFKEMTNISLMQIAIYITGILFNIIGLIQDTPTKLKYNALPNPNDEVIVVEPTSVIHTFPSFSLDLP